MSAAGHKASGKSPVITKQAVIVVHGMGEQQPMGTIRSFVETVFQRDKDLRTTQTTLVTDPDLGTVNRVWIVPDRITGSMELRRITTPPHKGDYRTDFFELYWADIMDSNPLDLVVGWVRGLLLRPPWRVPRHVLFHWIIGWVLALLVAYFAWAVATPDDRFIVIAGWLGNKLRAVLCAPFLKDVAAWVLAKLGLTIADSYAAGGLVSGIALLLIGLAWGLWNNRTGAKAATARSGWPFLFMALGIAILAVLVPPWATSARLWAAIFTGVSGYLVHSFAVPYLGDVARYVRATPSNVAKRKEIRERGLAVLRAVHGVGPEGSGRKYERVILVAHSLGAIIAYDLLMLFWEEIGPNHDRGGAPKSRSRERAPATRRPLRAADVAGGVRSAGCAKGRLQGQRVPGSAVRGLRSAASNRSGLAHLGLHHARFAADARRFPACRRSLPTEKQLPRPGDGVGAAAARLAGEGRPAGPEPAPKQHALLCGAE